MGFFYFLQVRVSKVIFHLRHHAFPNPMQVWIFNMQPLAIQKQPMKEIRNLFVGLFRGVMVDLLLVYPMRRDIKGCCYLRMDICWYCGMNLFGRYGLFQKRD